MENETELAYAEVDLILNLLDKEVIEKIPIKVREFFKTEKDKNYIPNINIDNFENVKLKKETVSLLTILEINYLCETEEEKQDILNELCNNEKIREEELREKYNPDNIFNKRNSIENKKQEVKLINYKEPSFIKKLLEKILKYLKIK